MPSVLLCACGTEFRPKPFFGEIPLVCDDCAWYFHNDLGNAAPCWLPADAEPELRVVGE